MLRAPVLQIHEAPDSFWRVKICKRKAVLTFILGRLLSWIQALSYPLGGWVLTPRLSQDPGPSRCRSSFSLLPIIVLFLCLVSFDFNLCVAALGSLTLWHMLWNVLCSRLGCKFAMVPKCSGVLQNTGCPLIIEVA